MLLPVALALAGVGLVVVGISSAVPAIAVGAVIASAGTGLLLPTLLTWALGAVLALGVLTALVAGVAPLIARREGRFTPGEIDAAR